MDYHERSYKSLCLAISLLSSKFSNMALPLLQNFYYDIIAEDGKASLIKIKVIRTEARAPSGAYIANIRKSGGYMHKKETKSPFDPHRCDLVFIETPISSYLIPSSEIKSSRAITLSQYEKFNLFRISSEVEQCAVNALVVGSNPTSGDFN